MLWLTLRAGHAIVLTSPAGPVHVDRLETRAEAALVIAGVGTSCVRIAADRPARVLVACPPGVEIRVEPAAAARREAA